MDIKGVLNAVLPLNIRGKEKVDRAIKSDSTTDRDANGQMPGQQQERQNPPMSDEQLAKAVEHLKSLDVVKNNNLSVEVMVSESKKFVVLREPTGKIVRRIPESELWSTLNVKNTDKGQLLRKTA